MEQSSNKSRAFMSNLDDQQLRQILLAEVESDDTDVDLIRNITAVLESRDHDGIEIDANAAYQAFVKNHSEDMPLYDELLKQDGPVKKRKTIRVSRLARVGIVAAIIFSFLVVTTGIASAAGIDIWGAFTRWTAKTFGLIVGNSDKLDDYDSSEDHCLVLRQLLKEKGVDEDVVPYYLPDGYRLLDCSTEDSYLGTIVTAVYENGSDEIIFLYTIGSPESSSLFPKDQPEPHEYIFEGVSHYLFENEGEWSAVWQHRDIGCQISGVISIEELQRILNSIYEGK